ncbi:MAG: acyl-CoA dehydrogenase family protein [Proteobacteria bacterium]|nr:acyl-CoA dehydrogenase family protein [Pseudomonadota bacterium]
MSIPRTLFDQDHEAFRDTVRRFMEQEVAPHHRRWEEQSCVDREVWTMAGAAGFLCATMPEEYGGVGVDKRFSVIVMEECARINATGLGWGLHSEIVAPYLLHYGRVVDTSMAGFTKAKPLHKVGMKAQDTCELFFDDVRVPAENLLGEENSGFIYLMQELPWERLQIGVLAIASAEAALDWTIKYTNERKAFGQEIAKFQNTRFKLAELKTEIQIGRVFVDRCIELLLDDKLDPVTASMAKYWCSDLQFKVMDECVQLHGGYGYMWEYPITRAWADARVQRIYGGTNEIMKELISRSLS